MASISRGDSGEPSNSFQKNETVVGGPSGANAPGSAASTVVERLADQRFRLKVTVPNEMGIHVRPAGLIAGICQRYVECSIWITKGDEKVNGKSVLQLISLQADQGSELLLEAEGEKALEALEELGRLVNRGFNDDFAQELPSTPA